MIAINAGADNLCDDAAHECFIWYNERVVNVVKLSWDIYVLYVYPVAFDHDCKLPN